MTSNIESNKVTFIIKKLLVIYMFIHTYMHTDMYWHIAVDYYTLFTLLTFGGHHHPTHK